MGVDVDGSGMVYCSEVLALVDMQRSPFTDHIFLMVGKTYVWNTSWEVIREMCGKGVYATTWCYYRLQVDVVIDTRYRPSCTGCILEMQYL